MHIPAAVQETVPCCALGESVVTVSVWPSSGSESLARTLNGAVTVSSGLSNPSLTAFGGSFAPAEQPPGPAVPATRPSTKAAESSAVSPASKIER